MKRKALLLALTLFCLASASWAQHGLSDPMEPDPAAKPSDLTLAQLLAKHAAARGGEQKLKAIKSVVMTGTWVTSQSKQSPVTLTITPGHYLRRIQSDAGVSVKAIDGADTWEITPQLGITKPTPMVAKDAARYRRFADPQGALIDAQAKKNKAEVVGKIKWRGSDVYKLKVTYPDGSSNHIYLDGKSFLPVRVVDGLWVNQLRREVGLEIAYEDYRDVNGVKWAFTEKASAPEVSFTQTTTWKTIEPNKQVDPATFKAAKD